MAGASLALIVASDRYDDPGLQRLRGPVRDAEALARILADPAIGGFEVRTLVNQPTFVVCEEIEGFFADRRRDDLLLVYFSCHGVKDDSGRLYFAGSNTKLRRLAATAVSSVFVNEQMDQSRSRKIVLLLDCCYSGAFARGMTARAGAGVDVRERFEGRGRVVITASTAMEYAFELDGDRLSGEGIPSVFTSAVVGGLQSGAADLDGDGKISVDELYDYVFQQVQDATPHQTPSMMSNVQGELYIAQSRRKLAEPQQVEADSARQADRGAGGPAPGEVPADRAPAAALQAPSETVGRRALPAPSPRRRLPWVVAVVIVLAVAGLLTALRASPLLRHSGTAATSSSSAATSTTTSTTPSPGVASRGTARLADPLQGFDLVNGRTVDFTQSNMAWNGSALAIFDETTLGAVNLGRVRFEDFAPARLRSLHYGRGSANPVLALADIPVGTVLAVHVEATLYAKLQILEYDASGSLEFRWVTYRTAS